MKLVITCGMSLSLILIRLIEAKMKNEELKKVRIISMIIAAFIISFVLATIITNVLAQNM